MRPESSYSYTYTLNDFIQTINLAYNHHEFNLHTSGIINPEMLGVWGTDFGYHSENRWAEECVGGFQSGAGGTRSTSYQRVQILDVRSRGKHGLRGQTLMPDINWRMDVTTSGKLTIAMENPPIFHGNLIHYKWQFSIAMLNVPEGLNLGRWIDSDPIWGRTSMKLLFGVNQHRCNSHSAGERNFDGQWIWFKKPRSCDHMSGFSHVNSCSKSHTSLEHASAKLEYAGLDISQWSVPI